MELLQDGVTLLFALLGIIASVSIIEAATTRGNVSRGRSALWGLLISFVCIYVISEVAGWLEALYLQVARNAAYGRVFSFAAFGLMLYVPIRIYQLMHSRRQGEGKP